MYISHRNSALSRICGRRKDPSYMKFGVKGLCSADGSTDAMTIRSLCTDGRHHSDEKGDKEEKYRCFFHYKILYHSYFQLFIKKNLK